MKVVNDSDWLGFPRKARPGICCGTAGGFEAVASAKIFSDKPADVDPLSGDELE